MLLMSNSSQHEHSFQFKKEKQVCGDRECTTELQIEPENDFLQMVDTQRQLLPVIPDCTNSIEQSSRSSSVSQQTEQQHQNIPLRQSLKQQL